MEITFEHFDFSKLGKHSLLAVHLPECNPHVVYCVQEYLKDKIPEGVTIVFFEKRATLEVLDVKEMEKLGWVRK